MQINWQCIVNVAKNLRFYIRAGNQKISSPGSTIVDRKMVQVTSEKRCGNWQAALYYSVNGVSAFDFKFKA